MKKEKSLPLEEAYEPPNLAGKLLMSMKNIQRYGSYT